MLDKEGTDDTDEGQQMVSLWLKRRRENLWRKRCHKKKNTQEQKPMGLMAKG